MDERAVRAAVERLQSQARGLFLGTGVACRLVPEAAIDALVEALDGEPGEPEDVPTDRSSAS